jgi:hypothetical protein
MVCLHACAGITILRQPAPTLWHNNLMDDTGRRLLACLLALHICDDVIVRALVLHNSDTGDWGMLHN